MTCELTLPLKHFPTGKGITISRAQYPEGLVVMPIGVSPSIQIATLPCRIRDRDSIILHDQEWPNGYVG